MFTRLFFRLGEIRPAHGFLRILGGLAGVLGAKWGRVCLGQLDAAAGFGGVALRQSLGWLQQNRQPCGQRLPRSASSGPAAVRCPLSLVGRCRRQAPVRVSLVLGLSTVNWQAQVGRQKGLVMLSPPTLYTTTKKELRNRSTCADHARPGHEHFVFHSTRPRMKPRTAPRIAKSRLSCQLSTSHLSVLLIVGLHHYRYARITSSPFLRHVDSAEQARMWSRAAAVAGLC
jgi:hypothetical protein